MTVRVALLGKGGFLDGGQQQLFQLAAGLEEECIDPLVLTNADGMVVDALNAKAINVQVIRMSAWRSLKNIYRRIQDTQALVRLCHAESIDLVHASDPWLTPYALAIGTQLGVPTIGHVRGPVPPETLRKYNLKKCTGVITVATRYQSNLRSAGVTQDRMAVIEDSVALDRFSPDLRSGNLFREEFSVGEKIAIGLVGRIEPFKKCLEWVEMVAECSHELPNAIFFIIGHASSERYAREVSNSIARHNLQRHVILTGRREDIPQALAGLDILVTLSGGSVMFEALAVGTPVLSIHERGQFSDHTIDGVTAKCYSGSCMKKAAMTLVEMAQDNEFRAQIGSRAAAHAKAKLSSPMMAKKTANFYRAILG